MALGLVGFAAVLAARLLSCIITSSIITRFSLDQCLENKSLSKYCITALSLHATLGTIDARWLAIVVLGALRGPGTYGERFVRVLFNLVFFSSVLCLTYAFSPTVRDVENFNVQLFRSAISIVIVITLVLQGVLTQVCLKQIITKIGELQVLIAGVDEAFP